MKISNQGIDFICRCEELELEAYKDIKGIWTIGYGHTGPEVKFKMTITKEQAEEYLAKDLAIAEKALTPIKNLTQYEYDALVSLVFNIGTTKFKNSTIRRLLLQGNKDLAANQFKVWNKVTIGNDKVVSNGLINRRAKETKLFTTGDYGD